MPNPVVVPRSVFQGAIKVAREQAYKPSPSVNSPNLSDGSAQQVGQTAHSGQTEKK